MIINFRLKQFFLYFKYFIIFLVVSLLFLSDGFSSTYNQDGDFLVDIESLKKKVVNDNIVAEFNFKIKNNDNSRQLIKIILPVKKGWDIESDFDAFKLDFNEEKNIVLKYMANSDFDYSTDVAGPNEIKISRDVDYKGYFSFPLIIVGEDENISLNFEIDVDKKEIIPVSYNIKFSTTKLSPISPLGYSISSQNLFENQEVEVKIELGNIILENFKTTFSSENNFRVFQQKIDSNIVPGEYLSKITVRHPELGSNLVSEWSGEALLVIERYENIINTSIVKKTFFTDSYIFNIRNDGNINSNFRSQIELGFFGRLLASPSSSSLDYIVETSDGFEININVAEGSFEELEYNVNYIPVYVLLLLILILVIYIVIRKNSNPLDIETSIYQVKTVLHEGVKSMKVRIGLENIRDEEIERLKLVFRMPSYLNVKDNSFLLSEPNHVLKGKDQYKLVWNFKRFEKNDSRILGFVLINQKGILGDIKLPDLEIEVKVNGKVRKYYQSFPVIKG